MAIELDTGGAILRMYRLERLFEGRAEVAQPRIVRPELRLQRRPGMNTGLLGWTRHNRCASQA
jgi:hypothetical protein